MCEPQGSWERCGPTVQFTMLGATSGVWLAGKSSHDRCRVLALQENLANYMVIGDISTNHWDTWMDQLMQGCKLRLFLYCTKLTKSNLFKTNCRKSNPGTDLNKVEKMAHGKRLVAQHRTGLINGQIHKKSSRQKGATDKCNASMGVSTRGKSPLILATCPPGTTCPNPALSLQITCSKTTVTFAPVAKEDQSGANSPFNHGWGESPPDMSTKRPNNQLA